MDFWGRAMRKLVCYRVLVRIFLLFTLLFGCTNALAVKFNGLNYDIYYGDFTDDGIANTSDIYFHNRKFILIHGKPIVPFFKEGNGSFVIRFSTPSQSYEDPVPLSLSKSELVSINGLQKLVENTDFFLGEFDGLNDKDILLRGRNANDLPLALYSSPSGVTLFSYSPIHEVQAVRVEGPFAADRTKNASVQGPGIDGRNYLYIDNSDQADKVLYIPPYSTTGSDPVFPPVTEYHEEDVYEDTSETIIFQTIVTDHASALFAVVKWPVFASHSHDPNIGNGSWVEYTPHENYYGEDSFTYMIYDGITKTAKTGIATINVIPVNDAPVSNAPINFAGPAEGGAFAINLGASDVEGDAFGYEIVSWPDMDTGSLDTSNWPTLIFVPADGFSGIAQFSYKLVDAHGAESDVITVELDVVTAISSGPSFDGPHFVGVDVNPIEDPTPEADYLGALFGEQTVSQDGSFNYVLPIAVPPGINGMEPDLAFSYNSNHRNGSLGWGWSVSNAREIIHRCRSDLIRDDEISGTLWGDNYKYCLNGVRLVPIGGNEYRTETETFRRITRQGADERAPTHWIVEDTNGTKNFYGNGINTTREDSNGKPFEWHLHRVEDIFSNSMEYIYNIDSNGVVNISAIHYTQNQLAQGTDYTVSFNYEDRPDKRQLFSSGTVLEINQRLKSIEILSLSDLVRKYVVHYQQVGSQYLTRVDDQEVLKTYEDKALTSRLNKIELCYDNAQIQCSEPVEFQWSANSTDDYMLDLAGDKIDWIKDDIPEDLKYDEPDQWNIGFGRVPEPGYVGSAAEEMQTNPLARWGDVATYGDFDGDGLKEIIVLSENHRYYFDKSGAFQELPYPKMHHSGIGSPSSPPLPMSLDINADGYDDYLLSYGIGGTFSDDVFEGNNGKLEVYLGSAGATSLQKADDYSLIAAGWGISLSDVNGDGLVDIFSSERGGQIFIRLNTGSGFGPIESWGDDSDYESSVFEYWEQDTMADSPDSYFRVPPSLVDVTGDGLPDLVRFIPGGKAQVGVNQGSSQAGGFEFQANWGLNNTFSNRYPQGLPTQTGAGKPRYSLYRHGDFNGDGLSDIAYINNDGIYISLSNGVQFVEPVKWSSAYTADDVSKIPGTDLFGENWDWSIADVNKDGMSDIAICYRPTPYGAGAVYSAAGVEFYMSKGTNLCFPREVLYSSGNDVSGFTQPLAIEGTSNYIVDSMTDENGRFLLAHYVYDFVDSLIGIGGQYFFAPVGGMSTGFHCCEFEDLSFPSGYVAQWQNYNYGPKRSRILGISESDGFKKYKINYETLNRNTDFYTQTSEAVGQVKKIGRSNTHASVSSASFANGLIEIKPNPTAPGSLLALDAVGNLDVVVNGYTQKSLQYHYFNLRSDPEGFGNLGFEKIQTTETVPGFTEKLRKVDEYHQEIGDDYKLTMLKRSTQCVVQGEVEECSLATGSNSSLKLVKDTEKHWRVRVYNANTLHYFPYVESEVVKHFDINTGVNTRSMIKSLSNLTDNATCPSLQDSGIGNRIVSSDVHFDLYGTPHYQTEINCDVFGTNGTVTHNQSILNVDGQSGPWLIGLVQNPNKTSWSYDSASNDLRTVTRHSNFVFDQNNGRVNVETREPFSTADIWLQESFVYNDYGTVYSFTESVQDFTEDGINFDSRTTTAEESYNTQNIRTIVTTNNLSHSHTEIFEPKYGRLETAIDATNLKTERYYDLLGRLVREESFSTSHDNPLTTEWRYKVTSETFALNARPSWYLQEKSDGSSSTRTYFDDLGREVANRWSSAFGEHQYSLKRYGIRGLLWRSTEPFRDSIDVSNLTTENEYDILGRIVEIDFPNGGIQFVDYSAIDGAAAATTTDSLGNKKEIRYDALGREVTVKDAQDGVVTYWHGALGHVEDICVSDDGAIAVDGSRADLSICQTDDNNLNGIAHHIDFDILGRKTKLVDPDIGEIDYHYNALGHLIKQSNDENETSCYNYDSLDRIVNRRDSDTLNCSSGLFQTWEYDRPSELGLLSRINGFDTDGRVHVEEYTYTSEFKLLESTTSTINGNHYVVQTHYDAFNRPKALTYPTGFTVESLFNEHGFPVEVVDVNTSTAITLWQATDDDARGNFTNIIFGNGLVEDSVYRPTTGLLESRVAAISGETLQNQTWLFDTEGNLMQRVDLRAGVEQKFCYDKLYRLFDRASNGANCAIFSGSYSSGAYEYDLHGNLTRKDGISLSYGNGAVNAGPHAVSSVNGQTYSYDNAGRLISGDQRQIEYSTFGKPTTMAYPDFQTKVFYGALQKRIQRRDIESGVLSDTVYVDKLYEKITKNGETEHRYYLDDWGVHVINAAQNNAYTVYLTRDHIGSVVTKSDDQVISTKKYLANEPWGRRQDQHWGGEIKDRFTGSDFDEINFATSRGFTNHEHLDGVGLIHMNGRVYDPFIGRFVSPDPLIQDPQNSQSFNRYSYVWNNPLRYTDPTGEAVSDERCRQFGCNYTVDGTAVSEEQFADQVEQHGQAYTANKFAEIANARAKNKQITAQDLIPEDDGGDSGQLGENSSQEEIADSLDSGMSIEEEVEFDTAAPDHECLNCVKLASKKLKGIGVDDRIDAAIQSGSQANIQRLKNSLEASGDLTPSRRALMDAFLKRGATKGLAGLSRGQIKIALRSAQAAKKGSTVAGHALSKHAGRNPEIWGKMTGPMKTWNAQAMKHFREIIRGPGDFKQITSNGRKFLEKRLDDGRGVRLNMDSTFKTFID